MEIKLIGDLRIIGQEIHCINQYAGPRPEPER